MKEVKVTSLNTTTTYFLLTPFFPSFTHPHDFGFRVCVRGVVKEEREKKLFFTATLAHVIANAMRSREEHPTRSERHFGMSEVRLSDCPIWTVMSIS